MFIHSNKEIDQKVNVSKIANNLNTMGDDSTAARCNSRLITVLVQHAHDKKGDIEIIEKVKKTTTKLIISLKNLPYTEN